MTKIWENKVCALPAILSAIKTGRKLVAAHLMAEW